MKKLYLLALLMMWFTVALPTIQAADDDLDALMNELEGDSDTTSGDEETTWDDELTDDELTDDELTDDELTGDDELDDEETTWTDELETEQVKVEEKNVSSNSITLTVTPVEWYDNYKVYYTEDGESNVWEQELQTQDGEATDVTLTDLDPSTTYNIVVKAFDEDGNPIESTTSEQITVTTSEQEEQHQAASDNILYNPTVKAYNDKIVVTYKPGLDVKKVQISLSEDGNTFKPVAVVDATTTTYTIPVEKSGKKYVKLVPVAEDGTLGVCKVWTTNVDFVTADIPAPKKEAPKHIGKPKTGPETYLLAILAVFAYVLYARRKMKA